MSPAVLVAPSGPAAAEIATLGGMLTAVCAVIYVLTLAALAIAVWRRRGAADPAARAAPRVAGLLAGTAVATSVVVAVLLLLTLHSVDALRPAARPALTVQVIGHRWWWEVRYPADGVVTANEIHLPARAAVRLELTTPEVIHSFWVPALHGKVDLVPGRLNTLTVEASAPGVHRGQCAEFCGIQHARMGLLVVAEEPEAFARWLAAQREPAPPADDPARAAGEQVFMAWCLSCHAVRGTPAAGRIGPDLTHVAARRALAAGVLANTPANLAAWIADPHAFKPGVLMPALPLGPEAVRAVALYVAGLR